MTRTPIYIAAPFNAPTPEGWERNTRRAEALGTLAMRAGFAPIVVHSSILRGVYGQDSDPGQRAIGAAVTRDLCILVAQSLGDLWVLTRDDGSFSTSVAGEVDAFKAVDGGGALLVRDWEGWRQHFERHGLAFLWAGLV